MYSRQKVIAAYRSSCSVYRKGAGKFEVSSIDPSLVTHLIYAFAKLDENTNTIQSFDPWCDLPDGLGNYAKFVALKRRNPNLKVTIAIGGWNQGSTTFSNMAASRNKRAVFARSVADFLRKYQFDGIDLDWEYPAQRGGAAADKQNFISLIMDLRATLPAGSLITAAIGAGPTSLQTSYDIRSLNLLDYIHVMTYDYHTFWGTVDGANSPLRSTDNMSIERSRGVQNCIGGPFLWEVFCQAGGTATKLGEPIKQNCGIAGPFTGEPGLLGFNEIKTLKGWNQYWDPRSSTPFMSQGVNLISYDNEKSITAKVNYAKSMGLAGIMIWSIETDDFAGGSFPLLRTIKKAL